jgi:predicted ATPase
MTQKYVLAGGPCCGKTTLLSELERRGYLVLSEVAREILEERADNHPDHNEHRIRQELIFRSQVEKEKELSGRLAFLDRGVFDNFAYQEHLLGETISHYLDIARNHPRYDEVFVLDLLPFEHDGLRIEKDGTEAKKLHDLIIDSYKSFGYSPIFVPAMDSPLERADFIIDYLKGGAKK